MPGFPLMAFGAGLGRFAEQYAQQQYANTQRQYVQMALNKQRQENEAQDLVGAALIGGGLPGFGSAGGGINPVSAGGGVGVPVASGGFPGSGAMPQPAPTPQSPTPQPAAAQATPFAAAAAKDPFYDEREAMPSYAAPGSPGVVDLEAPAADLANAEPAQPTPPGGGTATPAAPQPAPTTGFDVVGETKDGRVIFDVPNLGKMDLTSMFRQVDPQAIAQRIKELRPSASPAAIARATESLYKLANSGSKAEQLQTATLLKYLSATRSQDVRQNIASGNQAVQQRGQDIRAGTAAAGQATTQRGQDIRAASSAANRQQRLEQFGTRQSDLQAQRAYQRATGETKMQLGTLEKQMADIRGRMTLIINGSNPSSPANKAAMDNFNKQLDDLEQRRDAIAGQVLGSQEKTE